MTDDRGEPDDPHAEPVAARLTPRAATALGAALWTAAVAALAMRIWTGAPGSLLLFVLGESWLIGLGCLGVPIMILARLGNRLTAARARIASGTLFGATAVFTAAAAADRMDVITATFGLILLLAPAIHLYNAARALDDQARALVRGYRTGHTEGLLTALAAQRERAADLTAIEQMSIEEITALREALGVEIGARRARLLGAPQKLRAVPDLPDADGACAWSRPGRSG